MKHDLSNFTKYANEHFAMSLESMADMKIDLIWLYTHLEVKGSESNQRGKPQSKEYLHSIEVIKRASLFISVYCTKLEAMESQLQELKRRNDYLCSFKPAVDWDKMQRTFNGKDVKYIKDFLTETDNY